MTDYIHGYTERETQRLYEQSEILKDLLHHDTRYDKNEHILEAGCGVGAQTAILSRNSPEAHFTCVDKSTQSLEKAIQQSYQRNIENVRFMQADIHELPFDDDYFDHVFVCFVLEHLNHPANALIELKRVLKPGGTITVIEGDHGSCFWHPRTDASVQTWQSMIKSQQALGHDPLIGRKLSPLLINTGFQIHYIEPRWVYTDQTNAELKKAVSEKIITPMTQTAREFAISNHYLTSKTWKEGIKDIKRIGTENQCTFFYTWFKAIASDAL